MPVHSIEDGMPCWVDASEKERRGWRGIGGWRLQERRQNVARVATKNLVGKRFVVTMREGLGRRRSVSSNAMLLFVWQP